MWRDATRPLVENGELVVLGVVQEQHAERARLYAQWKQLEWPILHDPINQIRIKVVPVPMAIDEHGIVRSVRLRPNRMDEDFVDKSFDPVDQVVPPLAQWAGDQDALAQRADSAIAAYEKLLSDDPNQSQVHFRLGTTHRMRFDQQGDPKDFDQAVRHWTRALELDPNHYIFRRRIQQYGARLTKPYPFYDWVPQAIAEITARGEQPVALSVPLSGAEIARPSSEFAAAGGLDANPDPDSGIELDTDSLATIHHVVVPSRISPGDAGRVHLSIAPASSVKWNNEGGPTMVWIEPSHQATSSLTLWRSNDHVGPASSEKRTMEFEVKLADAAADRVELHGYALYHVCKNDDGTCLYLRQDFKISIPVGETTSRGRR